MLSAVGAYGQGEKGENELAAGWIEIIAPTLVAKNATRMGHPSELVMSEEG